MRSCTACCHNDSRCTALLPHIDRTPKQKLKIKVTAEPLLALFHRHKDSKGKQVWCVWVGGCGCVVRSSEVKR
jgi:hypothetical protein